MRFPSKCIVLAACWAAALATPAKIGDANLGAANAGPGEQDSSGRDAKLLFKFITIAPQACRTSNKQDGICYSAADCATLKGSPDGICAAGLGVCCRIVQTCGGTSGFRETTFTNPTHPGKVAANAGNCQLRITPLNNNICQLKLDFEELTLAQPNNEGQCEVDSLKVLAGSPRIPEICGDNSGQHMYVDVSPQLGSALINIDTTAAVGKWKIKVTQIECDSPKKVPSGCLQFFNDTKGTISSFNFNPANSQTTATRQLADQSYGMCINSQPGYCSVTYTQFTGAPFSLSLDPTALVQGLPLPPNVGSDPRATLGCPSDYLLIPGGAIQNTANVAPANPTPTSADRYCGLAFPGVRSSVQPFNLFLVTTGVEAQEVDGTGAISGDTNNQGFKLDYKLNAC